MKLFDLRKELKGLLRDNDIDESDADFIVAEVLSTSRTELTFIKDINDVQESEIREKIALRLNNVPVDKIFKKAYFYGLEFSVDDNVLSPRPESELLVETAIKFIKQKKYKTCLDLCTGSGCLAISIKKNVDVKITASDISAKALRVAKKNAKTLQVDINFVKSDMFDNIVDRFDIIVSNPPYIDSEEVKTLDAEVIEHDPIIALDGGDFGLKYYNIIHNEARKHLSDGGMLIMEIGEDQKELLKSLFNDFKFIDCIKDLSGLDRIMIFEK